MTQHFQKVIAENADVGVAYDGDGDRVGIVDDKGHMLDIDKFMIIIWRDLVKTNVPKKTFYDIKCSLTLKEELDKLGVANEFYRTGNSYTKLKSYEGDYPFGGELSGHVFFRDRFNGNDDGIYASLRLIEILSKTTNNLSDMLNGISKYYSTPEIKISTNDDIKFTIIDKVKGNPLIYVLQDSHIPALPKIIHIEMVDIGHLIAKLLLDAEIFGNHDAHVEILFVKAFGQRAHYVRQSSGFDKRDGLGSYE